MRGRTLRVVGIGGTLRSGSTSLGALRRALRASGRAGAEVELLDLRELDLPMYEPGRPLDGYGPEVRRFVEAVRGADALIVSTAAYHGTLAGVTSPARSRMRMCLEVELSEIGKALASSVTRASDSASRARIARRVPSDIAPNTSSRLAD